MQKYTSIFLQNGQYTLIYLTKGGICLAEYYKPEPKIRTSDKKRTEVPYKKVIKRQLIAALILFILLKLFTLEYFSFSNKVKENVINSVTYNTDLSFINKINEKINDVLSTLKNETKEAENIEETY